MTWCGLWKVPYGRIIPADWVWGVVDCLDALYYYHTQFETETRETLDCIEKKLDVTNEYLRLIAPGRGVVTIVKTVTPSPTPLYTDELTIRRLIVKVPSDALYLIYIGNSTSQEFIVEKGERLELFVKDPRQVYAKATGEQKIFLLFELAHE